MKQFQCDMRMW